MTRDELVQLRERLLLGIPPYEKGPMGELLRKSGVPGLHERKVSGAYDTNASGIILALEVGLQLCEQLIENMPRGADE